MNGHESANYQTKPHLARYSETKPKPLTLELLWILRSLLDAADPSHHFCAGGALSERGQWLASKPFGKVAEEYGGRLSQLRKLLPQKSSAYSGPHDWAHGSASGAGKATLSLPSSGKAASGRKCLSRD
jgi:hypothetical protein